MTKTFILLFVCAAAALAQPIGFGLKVGAPFTQAFKTGQAAARLIHPIRSDTFSARRWNSDCPPAWQSNWMRCIRSSTFRR